MLPSCSNHGFLSLLQGFPRTSCVSLVISFFFLFKCASLSYPIITFFFLFECHVKFSIFSGLFMQMYCQITYFPFLYKLKSNLHIQQCKSIFCGKSQISKRRVSLISKKIHGFSSFFQDIKDFKRDLRPILFKEKGFHGFY